MPALDALGDPVRRRIVELLAAGELPAGDVVARIGAEFGISQPAVSQHLKVLREHGIASARVDGARRIYSVDPRSLRELDAWLQGVLRFWQQPLDALDTELARGRRARRDNTTKDTPMTTDDVFDQTASLDAVQREMGRREIPAGHARTAVLRRTYSAPIADVWDAITSPDRLSRFFLPLAGDLREGGHYALEGNASGEILVCSPPELLRLQWTPPDDRGYSDEVEVRLHADGPESTVLELEHASVGDVFHTDPDTGCWGVGIGWEPPLHFLAHHLAGRLPDAPATEWFTFDQAAELRYAELRGREWAPIEAAQADGSHPAA